jgi:hypothetical protein
MSYPSSSAVTAGQPTAADHYNNLRSDALFLGAASADAVPLGTFLQRYAQGLKLEYLVTNRLRIAYNSIKPATVMLKGVMCQAAANIDLASGMFSGAAATWYVFANQSAGSTTFTLSVNTSATETASQVLIGQVYWDGANVTNVVSYHDYAAGLPAADYDSGWFACAYTTTYTKLHGFGALPRSVLLLHSTDSAGASECVKVEVVSNGSAGIGCLGMDTSYVYITASSSSTAGCVYSSRRNSGSGYYRILAWR